jgi:hypothetical protein
MLPYVLLTGFSNSYQFLTVNIVTVLVVLFTVEPEYYCQCSVISSLVRLLWNHGCILGGGKIFFVIGKDSRLIVGLTQPSTLLELGVLSVGVKQSVV